MQKLMVRDKGTKINQQCRASMSKGSFSRTHFNPGVSLSIVVICKDSSRRLFALAN